MKLSKLRIAWSVAWGIVAVLLLVLWVRSNAKEIELAKFRTTAPTQPPYDKELTSAMHLGIACVFSGSGGGVRISYYILLPFTLAVAFAWRLLLRFGLRALFVAMTIVAIELALVVWAMR